MSTKPRLPLASLALIPLLAGCSSVPTDGTSDQRINSLPYINYSRQDTCETQKQVEAYHSALDTMKKGRTVIYTPECVKQKPVEPASSKSVS